MLEKLANLLENYTDLDKEYITKDSDLVADLGLNSLDVVSIIVKIEEQYSVKIPDRDIWGFRTVSDVLEYMERKDIKI